MVADPREFPELHEACTEDSCAHPMWPNGWARLAIDLQLMTEEQQGKLVAGLNLLEEAGVTFDTGYGGGAFDVELDWSLGGAQIEIGPFRCMAKDCPNGEGAMRERHGFSPAYWSLRRRSSDGYMHRSVFCSETCREVGDAAYADTSELVLHDVAEALVQA